MKPEVMSPVIFAFLTSASVVSLPSELSSGEGMVLIAVDSRCRLVSMLNELKDVGRSPAASIVLISISQCGQTNSIRHLPGVFVSPMTCKLVSPVSAVTSSGIFAGTAGKVNCLETATRSAEEPSRYEQSKTHIDETRPKPSHFTPCHAQKRTSFAHPAFDNPVCPSPLEVSNMLRRPQNWIAFWICMPSPGFF